MMLPLNFPIVVSEPSYSCDGLVLNYVCCVLEKFLMSKSLTQKQERAATIATLAALEDGSLAVRATTCMGDAYGSCARG